MRFDVSVARIRHYATRKNRGRCGKFVAIRLCTGTHVWPEMLDCSWVCSLSTGLSTFTPVLGGVLLCAKDP